MFRHCRSSTCATLPKCRTTVGRYSRALAACRRFHYVAGVPPVLTLNNRIFCKFEEIANLVELKVDSRAKSMLKGHVRFLGTTEHGEPGKVNVRMLFAPVHRDVRNVDGSCAHSPLFAHDLTLYSSLCRNIFSTVKKRERYVRFMPKTTCKQWRCLHS